MVLSAVLVALLATMGQWWFFGPVTKCLVYPADNRASDRNLHGRSHDRNACRGQHPADLSGMDLRRGNYAEQYHRGGHLRNGNDNSFRGESHNGSYLCDSV